MSFESLGLSEFLLSTLTELGYDAATSVQSTAIPMILKGGDLLAAAQTGSGKTAAFSLPILQRQSEGSRESQKPFALILVPTRELADQVGESIARYGKSLPEAPRTLVAFGGVSYGPQMKQAKAGADIVVATPGRLIDLVERNVIDFSEIDTLVLDEADRLLALGFADELNTILGQLPAKRQNLLFSATFPEAVVAMADKLLVDPTKIQMEAESRPVESITQRAIEVERDVRTALLKHLMETESWERALVFVATKRRADNLTAKLIKSGIQATALHGDLSQDKRARALQRFKDSKIRVLLATDVAARGIDIAQLGYVVNYDLPRSAADYVHRIGRTGRAGESGMAISFVTQEDDKHFKLIEKRNEVTIEREHIEGFIPSEWDPEATLVSKAPVKGKSKSKKDRKREAGVVWVPKPRKDKDEETVVTQEVASVEALEPTESVEEVAATNEMVELPELKVELAVETNEEKIVEADTVDEADVEIEEAEADVPSEAERAQEGNLGANDVPSEATLEMASDETIDEIEDVAKESKSEVAVEEPTEEEVAKIEEDVSSEVQEKEQDVSSPWGKALKRVKGED